MVFRLILSTVIRHKRTLPWNNGIKTACSHDRGFKTDNLLGRRGFVEYVMHVGLTWPVSCKRKELLTPLEHLGPPQIFGGVVVVVFVLFVFVLCLVYPMLQKIPHHQNSSQISTLTSTYILRLVCGRSRNIFGKSEKRRQILYS